MDEESPYRPPSSVAGLEDTLVQRQRRDAVVLRIMICIDVGLFIFGFYLGMTSSSLGEGSEVQPFALGLMGLVVVATFVAWQALARLKTWGAWLYTVSYFSAMLLGFAFFETSWEKTTLESVVDWLTGGIAFSVMSMAHFSCALRPTDSR